VASFDVQSSNIENPPLWPSMVLHACYLSTMEAEAGRCQIQGHSSVHSKLKAKLGYKARLCLKKTKEIKKKKRKPL
jgi:hypothetical protein